MTLLRTLYTHCTRKLLLKPRLHPTLTIHRLCNDVSFEDIPTVAPNLIKKTLKLHNVQFEEGYTCFVSTCPVCKTSKPSKIYINKTTGFFTGPACHHSGHWNDLEKFLKAPKGGHIHRAASSDVRKGSDVLNDSGVPAKSGRRSATSRGLEENSLKFGGTSLSPEDIKRYKKCLKDLEDNTSLLKSLGKEQVSYILKMLGLPVVSKETMENLNVRTDITRRKLYFPLENAEPRIIGYRVVERDPKESLEPSWGYQEPTRNIPAEIEGRTEDAKDNGKTLKDTNGRTLKDKNGTTLKDTLGTLKDTNGTTLKDSNGTTPKDLNGRTPKDINGRRLKDTNKRTLKDTNETTSEESHDEEIIKPTLKESTEPPWILGGIILRKPPKTRDSAVLVHTLSDFLVLADKNLPFTVICLPNGLSNLPQQVLPPLERFHKLILWFGNNLSSWDTARNFAKKLGERRCLFVRPTDKQPLPHLVPENEDFKSIISNAQPILHKSITTFSSLRQDVLSDLQNIDKVQGVKWKRYPALTKILKGHRKGELTVLTGPTGSGKTTFMSEYSLDLAMQGVNTLWGSFEIRNARLARTMLQQMAGLPLDENLDQFDKWADEFEQMPIYFMTFHGQQSVKVVMDAVEHATYVHDIAHVIIDNLQFMMGTSEDSRHMDRFWKQDLIISAFRTFATKKNCHVSLVIHPRKEREEEDLTTSSIFGGAKASQEADNVLIIQDKRLQAVRGKKFLQVAKNRYSGDLGIMALEFDKASLSYAQKKKKGGDENAKNEKKAVGSGSGVAPAGTVPFGPGSAPLAPGSAPLGPGSAPFGSGSSHIGPGSPYGARPAPINRRNGTERNGI